MAEETKEPKVKRPRYLDVAPPVERGEDGLLKQVPETFDPEKHLIPRRKDFGDEVIYHEFKAARFESEAAEMTNRASVARSKAQELRDYGDPAQRAQIKKFNKYLENLKELRDSLKESGHDLDLQELLKGMQ